MSYRERNKGYQIDVVCSNTKKRFRTQIKGDENDAKLAEAHCKKGLENGKPWQEIIKELDLSRQNLSINAIYTKMKNKFNDRHSLRTAFNIVNQIGINTKVNTIDEDIIEDLVEDWQSKGNSNATCNRKLASLSKMLRYALKRHVIKSMPEIEWFAEGPGRVRYFSHQEEDRFTKLLISGGYNHFCKKVMFHNDTGLRKTEGTNIDKEKHLNGRYLTVYGSKNNTIRTIELTDRALTILKSLPNRPFVDISDEHHRKAWNYAKIKMGLEHDKEFTFHMTRHTCASRLVQKGIQIQVVQKWLGHKTIKQTLRYAHLAPHNITEARLVLENRSDPSSDVMSNKVVNL